MSFKGVASEDLPTLSEVKKYDEYAGILAENIVLIDVDDKKQSELLYSIICDLNLQCRVYNTDRGKHFYFLNDKIKKNGNKLTTALGISVDIKSGVTNSYSILKKSGKTRKIIRDCEEPQKLPAFLLPIKTHLDLFNMSEGDGRNESLYPYIMTLLNQGLSKREIKECFTLINDYIFDEPLIESELKTILREESFVIDKENFFDKNKFKHDDFALFLLNNANIKKINGQLHIYKNGVYSSKRDDIDREMLKHIRNLTQRQRNEVFNFLMIEISVETKESPTNLIAFVNGVYDLNKKKLVKHSPEFVFTNRIPHNYIQRDSSKVVDTFLKNISCGDNEMTTLLLEILGYSMYRSNTLSKSFIFVGDGSNGKSVYLSFLRDILGKNNVSALDIFQLNEKFSLAELYGKFANIGDDISDEYIANTSIIKKISTGETLKAERKGQDPFTFEPFSKLLFSVNSMPRLGKGKDNNAIMRRFVFLPFNAKFDVNDKDFDPNIKNKLTSKENIEHMIFLAVQHLEKLLKTNKFTMPKSVEKANAEYEVTNNPILGFFEEVDSGEFKVENELTTDVYANYSLYCSDNGIQCLSKITFSRALCKHYNLETKSKKSAGRQYRVFEKIKKSK